MHRKLILAINPGSTSTKLSIFENTNRLIEGKISHTVEDLKNFEHIIDQKDYRLDLILDWLKNKDIKLDQLRAVVGRGGLLRPMSGGSYIVTPRMVKDLEIGIQGEHASNLGGILAKAIADKQDIPAYIVDPVAVDEFEEIARISGFPEIKRKSLLHALNIKAVAHRYSDEINDEISNINLIVAHLGGGISVAAMRKGKLIDVNNSNEMGPFSPERTGELPVGDLVRMCFSGKYSIKEMKKKIKGTGGLSGYLATNDAKEVVKRIKQGDKKAELVFNAMAYQIGKEIGKMATVLKGEANVIIITGGLAYSDMLIDKIIDMVSFIADVKVFPGEDEMEALNMGALRVLENKEEAKIYENEVVLDD
ncbi:butyrate kinase [Abyssisolibacter fermentans]|uniref:butyrate kinase n=1 Tax=Abyssisolibacter fermentans TaxID=1766203 RepID=UPI00082B0EB5|nr:butyrate kinase [Abyssisolibacter fermentans]